MKIGSYYICVPVYKITLNDCFKEIDPVKFPYNSIYLLSIYYIPNARYQSDMAGSLPLKANVIWDSYIWTLQSLIYC